MVHDNYCCHFNLSILDSSPYTCKEKLFSSVCEKNVNPFTCSIEIIVDMLL